MIEKFVEENLIRNVKEYESKNDIYERYLIFCEFYNIKPLSKGGLTRNLNDRLIGLPNVIMRNRKVINVRHGLELKPCPY